MDDERFEAILRALGNGGPRRELLLGLVAGGLGLAAGIPGKVAGRHKPRHRRRQRRQKRRRQSQRLSNCALAKSYIWEYQLPVLGGKDFSGCDLSYKDFLGADFSNSILSGADLTGSRFSYAALGGTQFVGANLHLAIFSPALFYGADLRGATGMDTSNLSDTTWIKTRCPDGTFTEFNGGTCIGHLKPA